MEYPVIIEGRRVGKMIISHTGGKTVIDARCAIRPGIIRLSAYGCGKEIYLGVMQPDNGMLHIHKHFSSSEAKIFPKLFSHAGILGELLQEKDTIWSFGEIGILYAQEGDNMLCAIPQKLGIRHRGGELPSRIIDNTEYRIFKIGNTHQT